MSDLFSLEANVPANKFDRLTVDVPELYRKFPVEPGASWYLSAMDRYRSGSSRLFACQAIPFSWRHRAWTLLRKSGIESSWFDVFRMYWSKILGGRPLWGVEDLHFLANLFRMRFQTAEGPQSTDSDGHLAAWQQPVVLHQLLHLVRMEILNDHTHYIRLARKWHPGARTFLEFGCGTAPILTARWNFYRLPEEMQFCFADIETLAFHYAAYRFGSLANCTPLPLVPQNAFALTEENRFDVAFCIAVFEHLPAPLETIRQLHAALKPGGILLFDYIKSDAAGFDTRSGLEQRPAVLEYVGRNFELLSGVLEAGANTGTVVVRKR